MPKSDSQERKYQKAIEALRKYAQEYCMSGLDQITAVNVIKKELSCCTFDVFKLLSTQSTERPFTTILDKADLLYYRE